MINNMGQDEGDGAYDDDSTVKALVDLSPCDPLGGFWGPTLETSWNTFGGV